MALSSRKLAGRDGGMAFAQSRVEKGPYPRPCPSPRPKTLSACRGRATGSPALLGAAVDAASPSPGAKVGLYPGARRLLWCHCQVAHASPTSLEMPELAGWLRLQGARPCRHSGRSCRPQGPEHNHIHKVLLNMAAARHGRSEGAMRIEMRYRGERAAGLLLLPASLVLRLASSDFSTALVGHVVGDGVRNGPGQRHRQQVVNGVVGPRKRIESEEHE